MSVAGSDHAPDATNADVKEFEMEGPEVHVPHAPHTGHRWWDFAIGGTALLVSLVSLAVAVHHGQVMERLVAANSWPNVEVSANVQRPDSGAGVRFEISMKNSGIGPARVQTLELWNGATPIPDASAIGALIKKNGDGTSFSAQVGGGTVIGSVIGAGDTVVPLSIETADSARWAIAMVKTAAAIESRVCFCSVFDECHVADSRSAKSIAKRVDACPAVPTPYLDDISTMMTKAPPASQSTKPRVP